MQLRYRLATLLLLGTVFSLSVPAEDNLPSKDSSDEEQPTRVTDVEVDPAKLEAAVKAGKVLPAPKNADAEATSPSEMKAYTEVIGNTEVSFDMVPIPGGTFMMSSPEDEEGRDAEDEGPQVKVKVDPFWMGKCEVTWDEYDVWTFAIDRQRREVLKLKPTVNDVKADGLARPTRPYMDMTFDMGHRGYPAISMTQLAAKQYCKWLSAKTGHYYRLPTEAEWEYAARAGTTTAFSWGDDPEKVDEYEWYYDNSEFTYQQVGKKKPNPWGLHDIHGNVAEWVLDQYSPDRFTKMAKDKVHDNPLAVPTKVFPRVVKGGSWEDDPEGLRSAARRGSSLDWKFQDPQLPQSAWYHTDALGIGFRVVRPLTPPSKEEIAKNKLGPSIPDDARIYGQGKYDNNDLSTFER